MKIKLLLSALALVFFSNSQTLQIVNQYVFGGDFYDEPIGALRINNKTILGGNSLSGISGDKTSVNFGDPDIWIFSLDNNTNSIEWQSNFGGISSDVLVKIIETSDGNILVAAYSLSSNNGNKTSPKKGGYDFWLIKIDVLGNEIWQKSYGGSGDDILGDIVEFADGSVLLVGTSKSPISGDKSEDSYGWNDSWIIKIDENGNILWDKTIGGSSDDRATSVALDENENIIISGRSNSPISGLKSEPNFNGSYDLWVVKLDNNGSFLWDKTIGGDEFEESSDLIYSNEKIYVMGSSLSGISGTKTDSSRGDLDYWVTKLDKNGNVLSDKSFGGNGMDQLFNSTLMSSGELILAGVSNSQLSGEVQIPTNNNSQDFWVLVIDTSDLSIKNQFMFGGDDSEVMPNILQTENNSLLLFGASNSDVSGDKTLPNKGQHDFWILELSTDLSTSKFQKEETLSIFPNPTSNSFQISNLPLGESHEIIIYDMMGKTVLATSINATKNSVDVNSLSPGMYTLQMIDGEKSYTSKLIVE